MGPDDDDRRHDEAVVDDSAEDDAVGDEAFAVVPDRALRSALEFAVLVAAAAARRRPPVAVPSTMKQFFRYHDRLPAGVLPKVRAALEAEPGFFAAVAAVATADSVDEVGLLWLQQPDGWRRSIERLLDEAEHGRSADQGAAAERQERKRREAAEQRAERYRRDLDEVRAALAAEHELRTGTEAERERLADELAKVRARVEELERAARRTVGTARAADARAGMVEGELESLRAELAAAIAARDAALADRVAGHEVIGVDLDRVRELLGEAILLTRGPLARQRHRRRSALPLAGGLLAGSEAAAEHLLRHPGVLVLVDGYNVAKTGWPSLSLDAQRDRCVEAAERLARRWGTLIHVVFDGADVVGAHSSARRLVKVQFSPAGVLADDVLRAEVRAIDPDRPVVVVTDDRAVVADVRSDGANHVSSPVFLALALR